MARPPTQIETRPSLSRPGAATSLRRWWGLEGDLEDLPSERDQNFLLRDGTGRPTFVLKIANLGERLEFLDCQHRAMQLLAAAGVPIQRILPTLDGLEIAALGESGPPFARVLGWLPGRTLAFVRARPAELLEDLGRTMGRSATALLDLDHPAARRAFQWDVLQAGAVIESGRVRTTDPRRAVLLDAVAMRLREDLQPRLGSLRRSAIHNDANDHNVLVSDDGRRVTGLLDFGDMVHSVTAQEAAVACAYAMFGAQDPAGVIGRVVAGFDATCPLTPDELDALPSLILARLGASVAIAAVQGDQAPDPYLRVSEEPAWTAIEWLIGQAPSSLRATVHEAAGR